MKLSSALTGGLAGASALTLLHEIIRRSDAEAPRVDRLGMNAISKMLKNADHKVPEEENLYLMALAGDILSNSLYYSLAGAGGKQRVWLIGTLLGLAAGIGAVALPEKMGLDDAPVNRTSKTSMITIGLYVSGGLVTAAVTTLLEKRKK